MNPRRLAGAALLGAVAVYLNRWRLPADDTVATDLGSALDRQTALEELVAEHKATQEALLVERRELVAELAELRANLTEAGRRLLIQELGETRPDLRADLGEPGEVT